MHNGFRLSFDTKWTNKHLNFLKTGYDCQSTHHQMNLYTRHSRRLKTSTPFGQLHGSFFSIEHILCKCSVKYRLMVSKQCYFLATFDLLDAYNLNWPLHVIGIISSVVCDVYLFLMITCYFCMSRRCMEIATRYGWSNDTRRWSGIPSFIDQICRSVAFSTKSGTWIFVRCC